MLTKGEQKKYLSKKGKVWLNQLQVFEGSHDQEAIHLLRVGLKKIKAVVQLSKACSGSRAAKDFQPLKKMFRQAGKVRDAGNQVQLLEHVHPAPDNWKKEQDLLQAEATAQFAGQVKEYRKKGKKAGRRLLADVQPIRTSCIKDWYATQLITTGVLLTETGEQVHKARKRIKELLYILSLLPASLVAQLQLDKNYLRQLEEAIGEWHDAAMMSSVWARKDPGGNHEMVRLCREKEAVVSQLGNDFYRRAHLT